MKRLVLILTSLILSLRTSTYAADFKKTPVPEIRQAAERGDKDAQFALGQIYEMGFELPQDLEAARSWYRKAALQGHGQAWLLLKDKSIPKPGESLAGKSGDWREDAAKAPAKKWKWSDLGLGPNPWENSPPPAGVYGPEGPPDFSALLDSIVASLDDLRPRANEFIARLQALEKKTRSSKSSAKGAIPFPCLIVRDSPKYGQIHLLTRVPSIELNSPASASYLQEASLAKKTLESYEHFQFSCQIHERGSLLRDLWKDAVPNESGKIEWMFVREMACPFKLDTVEPDGGETPPSNSSQRGWFRPFFSLDRFRSVAFVRTDETENVGVYKVSPGGDALGAAYKVRMTATVIDLAREEIVLVHSHTSLPTKVGAVLPKILNGVSVASGDDETNKENACAGAYGEVLDWFRNKAHPQGTGDKETLPSPSKSRNK